MTKSIKDIVAEALWTALVEEGWLMSGDPYSEAHPVDKAVCQRLAAVAIAAQASEEPGEWIVELAERLVAAGPKAACVSASECHDIRDWIIDNAALVSSAKQGDDKARLRDYPTLLAFFTKHAIGTLTAPSCLCCGQSTQGVEISVQHMELPAIVVCSTCKAATVAWAVRKASGREQAIELLSAAYAKHGDIGQSHAVRTKWRKPTDEIALDAIEEALCTSTQPE